MSHAQDRSIYERTAVIKAILRDGYLGFLDICRQQEQPDNHEAARRRLEGALNYYVSGITDKQFDELVGPDAKNALTYEQICHDIERLLFGDNISLAQYVLPSMSYTALEDQRSLQTPASPPRGRQGS